MTAMEFEWDRRKARSNFEKHGVTFQEAASVFADALALTFDDPDHSADERRFLLVGESETGTLLVVSHTERGIRIRIISAREATRAERKFYEQGT